jgi:long-chain acyl-CoA synthetase
VKHRDQASGHVGGPTPNTEFKLVDVPEVNFFHTDKDANGVARPRGELYLRGPGIFIGYFRDPEKTKTVKDKYGWLHTGDLVEIQPKSGAIRVFGRKQNAFKLPTG